MVPDEHEDDDHDDDVVHVKFALGWSSALGWSAVGVGRDGSPTQDHEALAIAIAACVHFPAHIDQAVHVGLMAVDRPHPLVRRQALLAFGAIAEEYGRLPRREEAVKAAWRALEDPDRDVRDAAAETIWKLRQVFGE